MNKNTEQHITWFKEHGVEQVDISIFNRDAGKMVNNCGLDINDINRLIKFCRYKNSRNHCIYVRPHRSDLHKIVFVDDVDISTMKHFIKRFDAIAVRTSEQGGFQMWIATDKKLDEVGRKAVQTYIQPWFKSDTKSLSGEHLGRLAGFKNHKRQGGQWVNIYHINANGRKISTAKALELKQEPMPPTLSKRASQRQSAAYTDSGRTYDSNGLSKALFKIENDGDRNRWLSIGAALYSVNEKELWETWSLQSLKYDHREQNRTWNGFKNSDFTIGLIFHLAYST